MINLAVINIKDIIKFLKRLFIVIMIFIIIFKTSTGIFNKFKNIKDIEMKSVINKTYTKVIDKNILLAEYLKKDDEKNMSGGIKKILESELAIFSEEEKLMELENQEEVIEFKYMESDNINNNIKENEESTQSTDNVNIGEIAPSLPTRVILENNIAERYTNNYNSVKIKNESKYELTEEMLAPNIELKNKKDIIIFHTHTCESYTPTPANNYIASGNFRTTDLNFSVARVGTELSNYLNIMGFNSIHDVSYHDYPAYTGSYTRSLATINNVLKANPNIEFVIDLHRDALGSSSSYGPTVQIGDEVASQLMFVIGTDGGGLNHPDWLYNFKLAVKIQEKANLMYPGLFRPIVLRDSRYNQHVAKGACIIEVGATGNTLEQCNTSMKYLAKVISEVLK